MDLEGQQLDDDRNSIYIYIYAMRDPGWIAKLVNITPITMIYGTYNYSYWGESKPTYNWGPHIVIYIGL